MLPSVVIRCLSRYFLPIVQINISSPPVITVVQLGKECILMTRVSV